MLVSDDIALHFVMGLLRPVVLLPREFLTQASAQELNFALSHELLHIARHDTRIAACVQAFTLLFVGHPVARWFAAEVAVMREACVDARAGEKYPHAYAHFLLSFATRLNATAKNLTVAVAMADSTLARRIYMMTQPAASNGGANLRLLKLILALGIVVAVGLGAGFACASLDATGGTASHEQSSEVSPSPRVPRKVQTAGQSQGSLPAEAQAALRETAAMASNCLYKGGTGPQGEGFVRMNYSVAGDFESVTMLTERFVDTPNGRCVRNMFRQVAYRPSGKAPLEFAEAVGGVRAVQWGFQLGGNSE